MAVSRRSFTLGSTLAFLSGRATAQGAASPPNCETKVETKGIWEVRALLRKSVAGAPIGIKRMVHKGDLWVFRRTTVGDTWDRVGKGVRITVRDQENDIDRPEEVNTRIFFGFEPMFATDSGAETRLIPFGLAATEMTVSFDYFIDVDRGGTRERVAEGSREVTLKSDDRSHFFGIDLPFSAITAGGDQIFAGFQFSETFGLGVIAEFSGLGLANRVGENLVREAKAEVAAGQCQIPAGGGCFVVTASQEAGAELGARAVDLDLILSARDVLLSAMPQYVPAANQYYATAPELVRRINQSNHRHDIYARFVRRAVRPAEWLIRRGLPRLGFVWLGIAIEMLYRKHMPETPPPSAFAPGRQGA